jgi:hypothetical protein
VESVIRHVKLNLEEASHDDYDEEEADYETDYSSSSGKPWSSMDIFAFARTVSTMFQITPLWSMGFQDARHMLLQASNRLLD